MFSHEAFWEALDRLAAHHQTTPSGLARSAGLNTTSFNRSKRVDAAGHEHWPTLRSLAKVLTATGTTLERFASMVDGSDLEGHRQGTQDPRIPLIGKAQGGMEGFFDDSGFPTGQGWENVEFPGVRDDNLYAVTISGSSMEPLYRDGDCLIVSPGAQIHRGDRVIVKKTNGEIMAKVLRSRSESEITLTSVNPDYPELILRSADVAWISRVIWTTQ